MRESAPLMEGPTVSVLDELHAVEQRILTRLAELRPVMEEYTQLLHAAERLGIATPSHGDDEAPVAASPAGGTRATGAKRRQLVLTLIGEHPGITVPELSARLEVDPSPLYRAVRKLQAERVITKRGKGLRLASPEGSSRA
jgi:hypothetical protein